MMKRTRLSLLTAMMSMTAFAFIAVAQDAPPPSPSTTAPAGNWFGHGPQALPSLDDMSEAALFAQMYPELARMDKAVRAATPRVLFDGMVSKGKPALKLPIIWSVGNVFTDASNRKWVAGDKKDPWLQVFDERRARMGAVDARLHGASLYIDVETIPLDTRTASAADVDRSVRMIAEEVGWIRAQDPNVRLFCYSVFPVPDYQLGIDRIRSATTRPGTPMYQWWKDNAAKIEQRREARRAAGDRFLRTPAASTTEPATALADLFDATCPGIYYFSQDDVAADAVVSVPGYVREILNEARRYGKPVYPFVWYLQQKDFKPVPLKLWSLLMREVLTYADGAILWDGPTQWNSRLALRVRIATLLANRQGEMTDAELYEAVKADYPNDPEVNVLRGAAAATQQSP